MPGASSRRFFWLVVFISIIVSLYSNISYVFSPLPNIRGVEPNVVKSVQGVLNSELLYTDVSEPPYAVTQYTPLYYIVVINIADLLKIDPHHDIASLYRLGRFLSFTCLLGLLGATYLLLQRLVKDSLVKWGIIAFILTIQPWFVLFRPDSMATLTALLVVYLYIAYLLSTPEEQKSRLGKGTLIAIGFIAYLSFLTKQNFVIYWGCVAIFTLVRARWWDFVFVSAGSVIALIVTSIAFANYYSVIPGDGNLFYANILGGINNGTSYLRAVSAVYNLYFIEYLPLAFILVIVAERVIIRPIHSRNRAQRDVLFFLMWSALIVTLANLVIALKAGSAINYMTESLILSLIFGMYYISTINNELVNIVRRKRRYRYIVTFAVIWHLLIFPIRFLNDYRQHMMPLAPDKVSEHLRLDPYAASTTVTTLRDLVNSQPELWIYTDSRFISNAFFDRVLFPQLEISEISYELEQTDFPMFDMIIDDNLLLYVGETDLAHVEIFGRNLKLSRYATTDEFSIYYVTRQPVHECISRYSLCLN